MKKKPFTALSTSSPAVRLVRINRGVECDKIIQPCIASETTTVFRLRRPYCALFILPLSGQVIVAIFKNCFTLLRLTDPTIMSRIPLGWSGVDGLDTMG